MCSIVVGPVIQGGDEKFVALWYNYKGYLHKGCIIIDMKKGDTAFMQASLTHTV